MSSSDLDRLPPAPAEVAAGLPPAEYRFAPSTPEEAADILVAATDRRLPVLVWGGGTHQGWGNPVEAPIVISTARLDRMVAWEPDDLTVVVEAGRKVGEVEQMLAGRGQTAALPEWGGEATVGGVVSVGLSGFRRARYGPTRDRMLEATLVTGDGRIVRGGGRVVKNVSGFDIPRLVTGAFGSLGLITSVCLKLWPLPERAVTVSVDDPIRAGEVAYRPLAVIETDQGAWVYLQGTGDEVEAQVGRIGGDVTPGLSWPDPPRGPVGFSLRVAPALVPQAVERLGGWRFAAQHQVGEIVVAGDSDRVSEVAGLREWAESVGGSLAVTTRCGLDPWGRPPAGVELQRRLMAGFDPAHILNRGRLAGDS